MCKICCNQALRSCEHLHKVVRWPTIFLSGRGRPREVPALPGELQVIKDYSGWGYGGDQSHSSMIQPQINCPRLKPRPLLRCDLNTQLCLQRHKDEFLFNVSQYMGNGFATLRANSS